MSVAELRSVGQEVLKAKRCEDVFGVLSAANAQFQYEQAHVIYKRMARILHPDRWASAADVDRILAHDAFAALSGYWEEAQHRIERGIYGKPALGTITTKSGDYALETVVSDTDVAITYSARFGASPVWVKVAKHPSVNDFLEREVKALQKLRAEPTVARYVLELRESFVTKVDKGINLRVSVFAAPDGYIPLTEVIATHPNGVDPRHPVWMWKRLLHVLDHGHRMGLVHAAVIPEHVYVHPVTHGCILTEWGFAVAPGQPARALCPNREKWFPPEVKAKHPLGPATDLYMSAACMSYALAGALGPAPPPGPPRFTRLIAACMILSASHRTQSGRGLYDDVTAAASALYGSPRYVPLVMAH